ncbi:MAG TPA: ABC transporter substrate-binding protein [Candidatus Eisenbacteria bacterium]|nr:ABC transporter substrate-binding protein [Candidatus Eisenbacteria bacterium]
MRQFLFILWLALSIVVALPAGPAAQTVRIGSLGLSGPLLPLWVAQDRSLFAQYGLKTEVVTFQGGSTTIQALVAGEVQFAAAGSTSGVNAKVGGADIVVLGEWVNTLPYMLIVAGEIDTPEKLRNKRIAISRFGSGAHYAARLVLIKMGIDPDKDVQMLQIGDEPTRLAALRQGAADATVLTPPANLTARNLGFRVLTSLHEAGVQFSFDHLLATRNFASKNKDTVQRFLKGFLAGIAYMKRNREASVESLRRWMRMNDRAALEETYRIFVAMIPPKPYGTDEGWRNLLEVVRATNPKAKQLEAKDMIDYSHLREIEQSGFIDALYR